MTAKFDCDHDEGFQGEPVGYVPTHWKCVGCGARMTAGEMIIWGKLAELISDGKVKRTTRKEEVK